MQRLSYFPINLLLLGVIILGLSLANVEAIAQNEDTFGNTDEFVEEQGNTEISEDDQPAAAIPDSEDAIVDNDDSQNSPDTNSDSSSKSQTSSQEPSSQSDQSSQSSSESSSEKTSSSQKTTSTSVTTKDVETDDTVRSGGAEVILGITIAGIVGGSLYLYFRFVRKGALNIEGNKTHKK